MGQYPDKLRVSDDYDITETLAGDGIQRILLSPSKCYLNDDVVQLEDIIHEIVRRYNYSFKLFQLHHQNKKDYSTEFIAQASICCEKHMNLWWKQVVNDHPLPEGYQWMICNEESEHFIKTETERESVSPVFGIMKGRT